MPISTLRAFGHYNNGKRSLGSVGPSRLQLVTTTQVPVSSSFAAASVASGIVTSDAGPVCEED
jgi:hypothetical protein